MDNYVIQNIEVLLLNTNLVQHLDTSTSIGYEITQNTNLLIK